MGKEENNIRMIRNSFTEQYGAAFKMLEGMIKKCPDHLWDDSSNGPPFFKLVYHTLFFTDMYLSKNKEESDSFKPRFPDQEDYRTSPENFSGNELALKKKDVLDYLRDIRTKAEERMKNLSLQEITSEPVFDWHGSSIHSSMLYNLRHLMLHIGALQARLRVQGMEFRNWVSQSPLSE